MQVIDRKLCSGGARLLLSLQSSRGKKEAAVEDNPDENRETRNDCVARNTVQQLNRMNINKKEYLQSDQQERRGHGEVSRQTLMAAVVQVEGAAASKPIHGTKRERRKKDITITKNRGARTLRHTTV